MRKLLSLILGCAIVMSMAITAFASEPISATFTAENGQSVELQTTTEIKVLSVAYTRSVFEPVYAMTSKAVLNAEVLENFDMIYDPFIGEVGAYGTLYYSKVRLGTYSFQGADGGWAPGGHTLSERKVLYGAVAPLAPYPASRDTFTIAGTGAQGNNSSLKTYATISGVGKIELVITAR